MADFSDEFTAGADELLKNHAPDVGTAWVYTGTNSDAFYVEADLDCCDTAVNNIGGEVRGVGYDAISPELDSADQVVWGKKHDIDSSSDAYMCVRMVDANNFYGFRMAGTGATGRRLTRMTASTATDLITSQGVSAEWVRVKAVGSTITFWHGGTGAEPSDPEADTNWTQIGVDQTSQTDHQTEVTCGLAVRVISTIQFLTSFRASSLGGGGGANNPWNYYAQAG